MLKKLTMLCAALCVVSCANVTPPQRPVPEFDYAKYPPVLLDVSMIQVNDYIPTMQNGHVEHLMPTPLPSAAGEWARTRFKAVGNTGTAFITIRDASVVGSSLDRTSGIKGVFTIDQAERYDGVLVVEMRIEGREPEPNGNGVVKVERSQTISEDASLQQRDKLWTTMSEKMISDLDAATQRMIGNRLRFILVK